MKVLTAAQMREVDRRTIEAGIPAAILMENAGCRVVEFLEHTFAPLRNHRIAILCGKGNNGGDGLVIARQLFTRIRPRALHVVLAGDAPEHIGMLAAAGCEVLHEITPDARRATLVIDALLGTGLRGPAEGRAAEFIREINTGFPDATVIAVDVPSGVQSDAHTVTGDAVRARYTVTFTAPKPCLVLPPACDHAGHVEVAPIGTPPDLYEKDNSIFLALSGPRVFAELFSPRKSDSNKGNYGHVLTIAGARGKTGAAAMAGIAALRAGAGLSTVATAASALPSVAAYSPEIMTEPLAETDTGAISEHAPLQHILEKKTVVTCGPGLGTHPETVAFVRKLANDLTIPVVIDADALNALDVAQFSPAGPRVLTPHPGEMARLVGKTIPEVQADRVETARTFARAHTVYVVLKGSRTIIATPAGLAWINPTGSPALATGGTGDVLTGLIAGLIAQFEDRLEQAVLAAVWLHGRAGELAANALGEKSAIATDLFRFLPEAMREVSNQL
ncbi:MAG: NAD(P)H-hydrate dehydratase [Acidobacteriota bacterium]|nr:NAD(P)H-hydrate dehydratase [Acidobacteriota bacterium]